MTDPSPPSAPTPPVRPVRTEPPPWFVPSVSGGIGILVGIILGFFIGHCAGESSGFAQYEEKLAQIAEERDAQLKQAEENRQKEVSARESTEQRVRELQAKVLVGQSIELCLQALRELRGSNFGFVGRDLQLAREAISASAAIMPSGAVKVQLTALYDAFDPVLALVLKLEKKDLIEKAIVGLLSELRGARDKIAPPE